MASFPNYYLLQGRFPKWIASGFYGFFLGLLVVLLLPHQEQEIRIIAREVPEGGMGGGEGWAGGKGGPGGRVGRGGGRKAFGRSLRGKGHGRAFSADLLMAGGWFQRR